MRNRSFPLRIIGWLTEVSLCLVATTAWAQQDLALPPGEGLGNSAVPLASEQGKLGEGDRGLKLDAGFTAPDANGSAQIFIQATIPPETHIYSLTQPAGGPLPAKIKISPSADVSTIGTFQPVEKPKVERNEDYGDVPLESHSGSVKWVAPIQFARGVRPETVKIEGKVFAQLCDARSCDPRDYPFTATLRGRAGGGCCRAAGRESGARSRKTAQSRFPRRQCTADRQRHPSRRRRAGGRKSGSAESSGWPWPGG